MASVPPATLDAVLERITYANEETGYTVARVATGRSTDLVTVVGPLLGAQPGESLRLRGRWKSHPQYGRQFQVETYQTVLPATIQGIRRYLGSGLIKGIGPRMAERIVDHFGEATLQVIEQESGRLVEVPGLGPKRTAMITTAWEVQKAIKEVMVFLQGVGVSTSLAVRIYKTYQDEAIDVSGASRTDWPPRYGGSASRPPTRSPKVSASPMTAPSGSRPACSSRCRRPARMVIAICPRRSWSPRRGWSPSPSPPPSCRAIRWPRGGPSGSSPSTALRPRSPALCYACCTRPGTGWLCFKRWSGGSHLEHVSYLCPVQVLEADERAGQVEEPEQDVGAPLIANL
jgi:hypothetical protein